MPTLSRRARGSIFVDNVDFKRLAREYLRSCKVAPPADLDEALSRVSSWLGYPTLHALNQESSAAAPAAAAIAGARSSTAADGIVANEHEAALATSAPTTPSVSSSEYWPHFETAPFQLQPHVASGKVTPPAHHYIAAERLVAALNEAARGLRGAYGVQVDGWLLQELLRLDQIELLCWFGSDLFPALWESSLLPLRQHLEMLPGYSKNRFWDQRDHTGGEHSAIATLIAAAPYRWREDGTPPPGGYQPFMHVLAARADAAGIKLPR